MLETKLVHPCGAFLKSTLQGAIVHAVPVLVCEDKDILTEKSALTVVTSGRVDINTTEGAFVLVVPSSQQLSPCQTMLSAQSSEKPPKSELNKNEAFEDAYCCEININWHAKKILFLT